MSAARIKLSLLVFMVVVLASGWIGVWVDTMMPEQPAENSLGMGLWLILPLLMMLILRIVNRDWKDIGVRFKLKGNLKWYGAALVIYPVVMVIVVGLAFLFNSARAADVELNTLLPLIGGSIAGSFIKNIFEEFAWRGYLTPKLIELKLNDWALYFVSGLIWALWHAAYYMVFLPETYFENTTRLSFLIIGCVLMIAWSIMYVEIYRLTQSVWPCVMMHAVEDGVPTLLVSVAGIITLTQVGEFWLSPTTGIVTTVLFVGFGLLLRSIRKKKEQKINL
ncbi:type II CAAX prenyl endopeptidase Rce1 family protein [Paenibacillus silvae]|jgi:membrane protease YdiL (CAAX protease family)|uniref:CPBP family intramembrane glutamic endopeptidase n=1 Tax=Paenibacillus TaxID=44249 RepID=UPI001C11F8DF|nr:MULTISPECIES: CPBP family intramembrane glutamic endopeptidase [Paenibacillus]MBU5354699.1 CPBP family intramembrane metalloprotease [Paenibacillus barcinonensis]MDM5279869.1 CPBP family intramembrane metalloprotease [Paenibacillus silvae]